MRKTLIASIAATSVTSLSLAAAPVMAGKPKAKTAAKVAAPYVPKVTLTTAGNPMLGNPAAPTKVVEYLSYACGHCAHFHGDQYKTVRDDYLATGKASLEIRAVAHNVVGVAAALAVGCSKPGYFYRTHALFMETQGTWMQKIGNADAATLKAMENGDIVSRVKTVARAGGFYDMMAKRGTNATQLNACFADPKALARIDNNIETLAKVRPGLPTPTFLFNGKLAGGSGDMSAILPAMRR